MKHNMTPVGHIKTGMMQIDGKLLVHYYLDIYRINIDILFMYVYNRNVKILFPGG